MINKFQQGGKLQDAIILFVQGLAQVLQVKPEQVILVAQQNPKALESAVLVYQQTQDMNQAAQAFTQSIQKAKQGAKLQYLKSLKHQCADDEELYYYKKGGSVGCGCKKKEDGGEVVKANMGVVANFKEDLKKKQQQNQQLQKPKWTDTKDSELKKLSEKKTLTPQEKQRLQQLRSEFKNSSNTKDYEVEEGKKGMKVEKDCGGSSVVKKFKSARCGSKMKKHKYGGSLNRIPFYLKGTPKEGITEKSDNTRVQRTPNNGEGVYEQIPINGWDFVPIVGTYREALRLDQGDPNASVTRLGISLAGDLAGAGMIGSVAKAAGRVNGIQKALRARGYLQFTKDGSLWFRLPKKIIRGYGDKLYTYEIPNIYGGSLFKTIPTVDYTPTVTAPLVLTLRVPAEAPFFNYSK